MLLFDVRDNYYDDSAHAMMFLSSGTGSSIIQQKAISLQW